MLKTKPFIFLIANQSLLQLQLPHPQLLILSSQFLKILLVCLKHLSLALQLLTAIYIAVLLYFNVVQLLIQILYQPQLLLICPLQ
jgi:hypothetical protein